MKRIGFISLAVTVALMYLAEPVAAGTHTDYVDCVIDAAGGEPVPGATDTAWEQPGTGQKWFNYLQDGGWWNEWFYDDPPMPPPWYKVIEYDLCVIEGPDPSAGSVEIAINWSTMLYPENPLEPPLPPTYDNPDYVMREVIYAGEACEVLSGTFIIPDYNPEWISIDVRGYDVQIIGCIEHTCIPEPATLGLILVGGLALIRRKRPT